MNAIPKKLLAFLLVFMMVLSMIPTTAFAAEPTSDGETTTITETKGVKIVILDKNGDETISLDYSNQDPQDDGTLIGESLTQGIDYSAFLFGAEGPFTYKLILQQDIEVSVMTEIPAGENVLIDLNGHKITSGYQEGSDSKHLYPLDVYGNLTITDSVGNGSISGRGIYVQDGATVTVESGAIYGIDANGGSALYQYGGDIVIKGGLVEQKAEGTSNFAINAAGGTVTVDGGKIAGNHGAIAAVGAAVEINDGELVCTGSADKTDNVLYCDGTSTITINGGTFIADKDLPSGGCCIYDANGGVTVNDGDFSNSSGGDVWGTTGTTINGGTFENLTETQHVTVGSTITNGGKQYTMTENGLEEASSAVAEVNGVGYATLAEALTAASAMTGDVIVEIYDKVTLSSSLSGSFDSIKFVGMEDDAEIYLEVEGYITATGKKVAFEDLKLSKSEGGYITNAGFMNVAFGIYDVTEVTYTDCTFVNGAYAASGKVTYTDCTFYRSYDKYGLWAYGDVEIVVDGCIFDDYRGIKMYAEGAAKTVDLTVKNTNFTKLTGKPAIVLTYGESVTLEGNTYSDTGVFELDKDGAPNGTPVTSTDAITCVNDDGVCGVLVDGKIYTTVAQAAEVATSGSEVTLLHNSTETVELAEGVVLDKNGYAADGVTVKTPATLEGEGTEADPYLIATADDLWLFAKLANEGDTFAGKFVKLIADIDLEQEDWTPITKFNGTFDGDNHTIFNLWVEGAGNVGFFKQVADQTEHVTGTVKNVTFNNATIISEDGCAGLIADARLGARITNVKLTGEVTIQGYRGVGGIVGAGFPVITDCSVEAEGTIYATYWGVGGILGFASDSGAKVNNATVKGVGEGLTISSYLGGAGGVTGTPYGAATNGATISNVEISSSNNYYMAYVDAGGTVNGTVSVTDVAVKVNGDEIIGNDAIAAIDNAAYFSLQAAINAAEAGQTVKVLKNIELTEGLTVPAGKTLTLDLNGKTVSQTKAQTAGYQMLLNDGNLTIDDSIGGGKISYTDTVGGNFISNTITNRGTLTLKSGTVENLSSADVANVGFPYAIDTSIYGAASEVVVNIEGGTVTCANYSALRIFAQSTSEPITINISGGEINGRVEVQNPSNKTTDDYAYVGVLNITGGTINQHNSSMAIMIFGDSSTAAGLDVNISGGTVTGKVGYHSKFPVVNFDENVITGGTFNTDVSEFCALGYVCEANGDGTYGVKVDPAYGKVAKIGDETYATLEEAADAAQAGDTIVLLDDVTLSDTLQLPAGITLNGNDKTITGTIFAGGDLTFAGKTTVSTFNPGWYNNTITIGEGASLKVTSGRMTVSYGNVFNITGSIADAKTADKTTITPSLELVAGISFNGGGSGAQFNVTNAYVVLGDSTTKNSGATGEFNLNFNNSIVDFTKTLKTYMPNASGLAPEFNFTAEDSVIGFASHLELWLDGTTMTLDNTDLTVGGSFANAGEVNVTNGSNFVVNAPIMSSHGGNTGDINVSGGKFELVDSNQDWENAGTMTASGDGKLVVNDFKCVNDGLVAIDVTGMKAGDSVADRIVLNSENTEFAYTDIQVTGNDMLVVDEEGKLVELDLNGSGTEADPYTIGSIAELQLFAQKVNGGKTYDNQFVKLTADIDLNSVAWTPIGNSTNRFLGTFDGDNHTISNLVVDVDTNNAGLFGFASVIKNVKINNAKVSGVICVGALVGELESSVGTVDNCHVTGTIQITGENSVGGLAGKGYANIKNSSVIGNADSLVLGVYGSTEEGDNIGGLMGHLGEGNTLGVNNVTVKNITVKGTRKVGGVLGTTARANDIIGCTVENVTVESTATAEYANANASTTTIGGVIGNYFGSATTGGILQDCSVNNLTLVLGNAKSAGALVGGDRVNNGGAPVGIDTVSGNTATNVTGATNKYLLPVVAQIGDETYATLQEALNAAAAGTGNVTVEILSDVDLTGIDWEPVTVSAPGYPLVTVNGNDKTITGLNDMLFAGTWAGNSGLIINNLTIKDSTIVNDENDSLGNVGVGAFIGYPQASATITLNDCHLVNSTVKGGHWTGGLIGMAGGYSGNDGPVFMDLTITGCSVTGSTISGKGSVGGVIGHGSCSEWTNVVIENTSVSGNTITSTGSSTVKAGSVMGTIGAAGQEATAAGETKQGGAFVSATVSDNAVTSGGTAITTIYGRQGTPSGTLELTGGTYDSYPVEENVAYAYPAEGMVIEENNDGTYGIAVDPAYGKVAKIGDTYYDTLAEAIAAVQEGETVTILAGTISEGTIKLPATLKNVTIKGTEGAILKDMTIMAHDGNNFRYEGLTFDGITFDNSRIVMTGWRNGEEVIKDLTITNCIFKNLNDTTNSAPVHINKDASEAVENFTFTNNVIDGATGGSKSGIYAQLTGEILVKDNTINNVAFRPFVIQITTDDGIADNFIVTGNTFSGSAAGRAQGLGNNSAGTDIVNLVVNDNIFKGITNAQQICYWNFNAENTTADLSKNYYDVDILQNPSAIYFNGAAADVQDLVDKGVFPYYEDEAKTKLVNAPVACIGSECYDSLKEAIDAAQTGDTVTLLIDVALSESLRVDSDITLDLAGKKLTAGKETVNLDIYGKLTIKDTVGGGVSTFRNHFVHSGAELIVESGTLQNIATVSAGFPINLGEANAVATINGGVVQAVNNSNYAVTVGATSTLNVNGGTIKGNWGCINSGGTVNIENGTFDVTGNVGGHCVYAYGGTVTIKNGDFNPYCVVGENATCYSVYVNGPANVTIENGNFAAGLNNSVIGMGANVNGNVDIYGGTFAAPVAEEFCAEGYIPEDNGDGTYTVKVDPAYGKVAKIGDTYYADLAEAIAAAKVGETVLLLKDVDLTGVAWEPVELKGSFDGQDHTISNLTVNKPGVSNVGFFSMTTNGEVKNVTFENAKVTGRLNVGVVAGTPYTTKYTNVKVTGHVEVEGMAYVGGVGGKNAYANWTDVTVDVDDSSYVKATSTEDGIAYRTYVGGLVGFNGEGGHTFKNVSSNIKVIGDVCDIGGLFGIAHYGNNFENVTFTGSVEAPEGAEEVGGIAGVWHNQHGQTVTFTNVTSTGTVTVGTETTTGSIVGGAYNASNESPANSGSLIIDGEEAWLCVAKIGDVKYYTLAEALAAANGGTVEVLCDIEESISELTDVTLVTNVAGGVTINNTYSSWCSITNVTIGEGVTLVTANALFDDAGVNVIEGTVHTTSTFYHAYDSKTTVQNGGKIISDGMIVNRYHNNADAGIYVYGDGDDATVEVQSTDTIGTYSGTFYAKDAVIKADNHLWIDYLKNSSQEADKYSQSTPVFENSTVTVANELRLYKDATLTLTDSTVTAGKVQVREAATPTVNITNSTITATTVENLKGATLKAVLAADGTVSFLPAVAQVGDQTYATLSEAMAAANAGDTVILLAPIVVAAGETMELDLAGKILSYTSDVVGEDMITNYGTLTINDTVGGGKITYCNTDTTGSNVTVSTITNAPGGVLTVNGGTIENTSTDANAWTGKIFPFTIDNVTNATNGAAKTTINGGTIKSNYRSIRLFANSTTDENAVNITGGEMIGQVWLQAPNSKENKVTLTVSGGSFAPAGKDGSSIYVTTANATKPTFQVTGGNFATKIGTDNAALACNDGISGGTFTAAAKENTPAGLIRSGYEFTANDDGTYGVVLRSASGKISYRGYINDSASREAVQIDLENVYARESLIVKVFDANGNLLFTTKAKASAIDAAAYTVNAVLWGTPSGSWDTTIAEGVKLTVANAPSKAELWVDGNLLDTFENILGKSTDAAAYQLPAYLALDCVYKEAEIDGVYYATLADALAAAQTGETVTLLTDLVVDTETYTIPDGKSITLDMNGKKITVTDNSTTNYELFYIYGEMTITGDGTIELTSTNDRDWNAMSAIFHNRGGVLTIENGTYTNLGGTDMAWVVDNSGNWFGEATTNIEGGTLTSTYTAIRNRMEQNTHGASGKAILNISGGTIDGTTSAIWAQAASTSTVAPATGEINISGGEIGLINTARSNGAESMTTITGGSVAGFKGEVDELRVTGGTIQNVTIMDASNNQIEYVITDTGLYTAAVAKIGTTNYATLQAALDAAQDGDTVTVLTDIALDATVRNTKEITLDLNGKVISGVDNNTSGNYYLINNTGKLTIKDSATGGKITLKAMNDTGYNRSSVTVANNPGGKLVVESGIIEHTGGHTMAYAIDNMTNGKGTYAETVINGGTVESSYVGIRQFLNGVEAQNILTVNGGTVTGANTSIFFQDPSANCNSGKLYVGDAATLGNRIYVSGTAGTDWDVEFEVSAQALGTYGITTDEIPASVVVKEVNGFYIFGEIVAYHDDNDNRQLDDGELSFETVTEALAAAKSGEIVVMLTDAVVTDLMVKPSITLDLNGNVLTADFAVTFTSASIVDATEGEGLLKIGMNDVILQKSNAMIPVYNGEGYIFGTMVSALSFKKQSDNQAVVKMVPAPALAITELFKDGAADNNVKIVVRLTWTAGEGSTATTKSQDIVINEEHVKTVFQSHGGGSVTNFGQQFEITIKGIEGIADLQASLVLVSGTGSENYGRTRPLT